MYRLIPIQTEMVKRVGFRKNTHPNLPQLVTQLTESKSGIYVQDRHPLLNTNNIYMASENFDQWPYEPWAAGPYQKDEFVTHVNQIWVSDINNNVTEPGQPLATWTEINNFSSYLLRILNQASQRTIEKIFQYKKAERNTKTIFENIHLFDGSGTRNMAVTKVGRFVGFSMLLLKHRHLTAVIRKIGTQFNNATGPINLYVYHESKQAPIIVIPIDHLTPNSFQWNNIEDLVLPYVSDTTDAGGRFFIGYYEDDLPVNVQAIRRYDYMWNEVPCGTCSGRTIDIEYYRKWSAYTNWCPIEVAAQSVNVDRSKFDNEAISQQFDSNFGLNFHLSLKCDLTDFLIENISVMDEAYANQVGYELLNSMAYTLRDNGDAKQVRDKAAYEMSRTDEQGISKILEQAFKAMDFEMSGFNSVCLPDNRSRGVRTGSMI